jgi:hypothetical protein
MRSEKASNPSAQRPIPRCKAVLLCDRAIVEAGTGKISAIGIFNSFTLAEFPGITLPFSVLLVLVDGINRYRVRIAVHDLARDVIVGEADAPDIIFPQRLQPMCLVIPIAGIEVGHPGAYDLIVFADGAEIDRHQFQVVAAGAGLARPAVDDGSWAAPPP